MTLHTDAEPSMPSSKNDIAEWDALDIVLLAHAGLAQDSPEPEFYYLNRILNLVFGYLTADQRKEVDEYLAEKKYLGPAPKIEIAK